MTDETSRPKTGAQASRIAALGVVAIVALCTFVAACPKKQTGMTDAQAAAARKACTYDAGALPEQTFGTGEPRGTDIPIEHIILLMQENRSFDHYFSKLGNGADVASPTVTNPDGDGGFVQRFHMSDRYCFSDTNHSWDGVAQQVDDGGMDGFVITNNPDGERAMGYYDDTDIPFYYDLASSFAISDRHFCSAPGDTSPNREFFAAASARGCLSEMCIPPNEDDAGHELMNVPALLNSGKVDWKFYTSSTGAGPELASLAVTDPTEFSNDNQQYVGMSVFFDDLDAGTLPSVSWVDIGCCSDPYGNNEHPSADMQVGQHFVQTVVQALMASSAWPKSALFITWDEHGGQYDHVEPPAACSPDDYPGTDAMHTTPIPHPFDKLGIRVPLIVVSPYARHGYVSHVVTDHTSILRFVEARYNLPALTRRDANATAPFDMFDFSHPIIAPPTLREAVIDPPDAHGCN
jgi:phospholipase C